MKILSSKTDIMGMARIGHVDDKYEVYVNTDDGGSIPHFHFRDAKDWNKFHTCIYIEEPKYFHHTGKEDVLNSSLKKKLQEFMEQPVKLKRYKNVYSNNWELVCDMWDMNNSNVSISEDVLQPDYRNLP